MSNLHTAHNQWSSRPADERFASLETLHAHNLHQREIAKVAGASWSDLKADDQDGGLVLVGKTGVPVSMTNWSFGQIARAAGAPPSYLGKLPTALARDCLNHGLRQIPSDASDARLLMSVNGERTLRAVTSESYTRIWNSDLTQRLADLGGNWKNPMAYAFDQKTGRPSWGGAMEPAGLYAGDRDMFVFMIDESRRIEDGSDGGLSRGFFLWNSEVGSKSFGIATFLFQHVCGNHIVWGASKLVEKRIRHVGEAGVKAFAEMALALGEYANAAASVDEANIAKARQLLLGETEDEVVEAVVKVVKVPQVTIRESYKLATEFAEVNATAPGSVWGMVNGITRYAQLSQWTDDRVETDRVAQQLFTRVVSAAA